MVQILDWREISLLLPKRAINTSKSDYGHVLVAGGDHGMAGAVRLAAEAALRVGAGLVSVATRQEHISIVSGVRPEIMCYPVSHPDELGVLIARATVLVIGPGLGKSEWSKGLFNKLLNTPQPKIIDADGLNLLAEKNVRNESWILTPHPGEAARLLKCTIGEIQQNRMSAVKQLQNQYGGVVVLKGAGTLVHSSHSATLQCPAGNPGMASGGMGDVLSGVIGGLAAQKLSLAAAAQAGVLIHSLAADQAAKEGERGLLASDLFLYLRKLVNPEFEQS